MSVVAVAVVSALALPAALHAQSFAVDRGSWLVAGSASWTSSGDEHSRSTAIFLSPSAQYFLVPGLALGASAGFSQQRFDAGRTTSVAAGPAVTYYVGRDAERAYPYVGGSARFGRATFSGSSMGPFNSRQLQGYAGAVFMLARNVGVDSHLFYSRFHEGDDLVTQDVSSYGLGVGLSAFVF